MENSFPEYSIQTPRRQYFSLPFDLISRLLETESPHLLLKLQKSCKHFFAKKKVIVVGIYIFVNDSMDKVFCRSGKEGYFEIVLDKGIQYWFTRIAFSSSYSIIRPHIYRLTLKDLHLCWQNLSRNDIDFLLSNDKTEALDFYEVTIRDDHGNPVPIDYILGKVPNVTRISFWNQFEIYSNQLLKKLNSIKFNQKLKEFILSTSQTSEVIDAEILGEFVERNLASDGFFGYYLPRNAPELEAVTTKLQQIVDMKKVRFCINTLP